MAGSVPRTSVSRTISSQATAVAGVPPNIIVRFQSSWAPGSSAMVGAHSFRRPALSPQLSPMRRLNSSISSTGAPHG
jgi:hypothetical protein